MVRVMRPIELKYAAAAARRVSASPFFASCWRRAPMLTMKPRVERRIARRDALAVLVQTCASARNLGADRRPAVKHAIDDRHPFAGSSPAGSTIGQASTHLPQRVHASRRASIRAPSPRS